MWCGRLRIRIIHPLRPRDIGGPSTSCQDDRFFGSLRALRSGGGYIRLAATSAICQRFPALPFGLPSAGYLVPLGSLLSMAEDYMRFAATSAISLRSPLKRLMWAMKGWPCRRLRVKTRPLVWASTYGL